VLTGLGAGFVAVGGLLFALAAADTCETTDTGSTRCSGRAAMQVTSLVATSVGGAMLIAGIPTLAVGYARTLRWLPAGTLDGEAPAPAMSAGSAGGEPRLLAAGPFFTRSGAGVGLSFAF